MKKIKIFLAGYINFSNAQNLNCMALAKNLDTNRFEIKTMTIFSGNLDTKELKNKVQFIYAFRPHKISKYISYLKGILWADVVYLPKGEICDWNRFWVRILGKKSFKTVEGIYGKEMLGQILDSGSSYEKFLQSFEGYDRVFSITRFLKDYNVKHHGIKTEEKILYLGTNSDIFLNEKKNIERLQNIIFIGRLKKRKGIFDFLEIAKAYPHLNFYMAGNGEDQSAIESYIQENNLKNVELLGTLTHPELAEILRRMDLHIFPSRSEGFPKVTLETAAAGVPSVVYPDYGADEWIENGINGFIVNNKEEIKKLVESLENNPGRLREASKNAIELGKQFDWKNVIKDWENVIIDLFEKSQND